MTHRSMLCGRASLVRLMVWTAFAWLMVSADAGADWTASGHFDYTDRLYDLSGFTGTAAAPVREADVEVYDINSLLVLGSGATDSSGDFSIAVIDASTRDVGVRVLASTNETASLVFRVVDDKSGDATFSYHDGSADESSHGSGGDVNFGTMTMPAAIGDVGTTDWSSQVFNTFDMAVLMSDWVASVDGSRPTVAFVLGWNPTNGRSGSFYFGGSNRVSLGDGDAYDDPVVIHELGHYIEDEFGSSQNPGGIHFLNDDDQDPRLSFSEGLATFFSNAALELAGRPRPDIYCDRDSFGISGGGGFAYQLESAVSGGSTNEQAVNAALWDIIDTTASLDGSPGADDDPMSDPHANVWAVVEQMRVAAPAHTQMEDFWTIWFSLALGSQLDMESAFAAHDIDFQTDGQEPNGRPTTATPISAAGSYQENTFYRSGTDASGDEDWFRFPGASGTYYRIQFNTSGSAIFGRPDPELFLLGPNLEPLAYSDDPFDASLNNQASSAAQDMDETLPTILFRAAATGDHYIYVRHASYPVNLGGSYGTYQIRVKNAGSPTPSVNSVAAQRMLPGESYQALVIGSDFAVDAGVTLSDPGLTASSVDWISPTALVASIDVDGGVSNGIYSLTVSNPGAGSDDLSTAIEVNSAAQPPVVITEVELGADKVEVRNLGTGPAVLTSWQIHSYRPGFATETFTFPSFTLPAGATVVVSEAGGTNTATELFDQGGVFNWPWANGVGGGASLVDDIGRNVDYIRFVDAMVDEHENPLGFAGLWMQPELLAPASGSTLSRDELNSLFRSRFGLSVANPTMPTGASGRDNAVDAWEDNDTPRRCRLFSTDGTIASLEISPRAGGTDDDWFGFAIAAGDSVGFTATFSQGSGNLDMELYPPGEESVPIVIADSITDDETIVLTSALSTTHGAGVYRLRVYGFLGAVNSYSLTSEPLCGNGVLDPGETCDDPGDCCSTCQLVANGIVCNAAVDLCDAAETCDGISSACPSDIVEPNTTQCRPSSDVCDAPDFCDGVSNECPADAFEPGTTECRPAEGVCDAPDFCDGVGAACPADLKLNSECRAVVDICDLAEACDGVADDCPPDAFEPGTTECRASTGVCDVAELCTGSGPSCPADAAFEGVPCPDGDLCNGDEICDVLAACVPGSPPDCDDQQACTADGCDAIEGCFHDPIPGCVGLPALTHRVRALFALGIVVLGAVSIGMRRSSRR